MMGIDGRTNAIVILLLYCDDVDLVFQLRLQIVFNRLG